MPVRIGALAKPRFGAAATLDLEAQLQPDCWAIAEPPERNAKLTTDNTANEIDLDIFRVPFVVLDWPTKSAWNRSYQTRNRSSERIASM